MKIEILDMDTFNMSAFTGKNQKYDIPGKYRLTEGEYLFIWKVPMSLEEEKKNGLQVFYQNEFVGFWRWQSDNGDAPNLDQAETIAREIARQDLRP